MDKQERFKEHRRKWNERKLKSLEAELKHVTKLKAKIELELETFKKEIS